MKKRKIISKRLVLGVGVILLLLMTSGFAGFMGTVTFQGTVSTATAGFEIVEYSGTWVYKDLITNERVILDYPSGNPDYLYVASSYATDGTGGFDVDFVFDNIYPCIFFKADFIVHYIGSIPVHLKDISFEADPWLEPYISWRAYACTLEGDEYVKHEQVQIGYQLHYCMYLYVDVIVKLPQDNSLQGLNGYFQGSLEVLQWDDDCTKYITIPEEPVTMVASNPGVDSYFDCTLSDVPSGYTVVDGLYRGWCIDEHTTMLQDVPIQVTLYSSYDPIIDSLYPDDDWDLVNYLLNNKHPDASMTDIQDAIWYFINGGVYPDWDDEAKAMVDDAIANGEGFTPTTGQWIAVYVLNDYQQIFIEVDP